jgi:hypothetical protein
MGAEEGGQRQHTLGGGGGGVGTHLSSRAASALRSAASAASCSRAAWSRLPSTHTPPRPQWPFPCAFMDQSHQRQGRRSSRPASLGLLRLCGGWLRAVARTPPAPRPRRRRPPSPPPARAPRPPPVPPPPGGPPRGQPRSARAQPAASRPRAPPHPPPAPPHRPDRLTGTHTQTETQTDPDAPRPHARYWSITVSARPLDDLSPTHDATHAPPPPACSTPAGPALPAVLPPAASPW